MLNSKLKKKVFIYLTILSLLLSYSPVGVYAQSATSSSHLSATGTEVNIASDASASGSLQNNNFDANYVNSTFVPSASFSGPDVNSLSPNFDAPSNNQQLSTTNNSNKNWTINSKKNNLQADEDYQVNLDNISPQDVSVQIYDQNGNLVNSNFNKIATSNGTSIDISPPSAFRPGKYTVKITDTSGNVKQQDFTWGVLAINTDKSIYLPNETANLAMAVLDNTGDMVCDANVTLTITDPNGKQTVLSTSDNSIIVNPSCHLHNFTLIPDYQASFTVGGVGAYQMDLLAETTDGTRQISDSFQVQNSVAFDITRQTATRIYPPSEYPVNLTVKFNQDFNGQIIDYVPNDFNILPSSSSAAPTFDVKEIATPVKNQDGNLQSLKLLLPFKGTVDETLGFGQHLLDPKERDYYAQYGLAGHDGLDFAMPIGTPVYSTDDGVVIMAGGEIYGTTVVIQHGWGRSYYGHLSKVEVTVGQKVSKGDEIALSGNTGITTGPHLHFGIKFNQNDPNNGYYGKTDPSPYLGLTPQNQTVATNINNTVKAIVWTVNARAGDTLNLSYNFKMPMISPMFYTIGPLSFVSNNQVVFQEVRKWQLAADAATVIIITSSYTDPCGSNCWTVPSDWNITGSTIEAVGAGGGGGSGTAGTNTAGRGGGGGGGGGEYRKISSFTTTPGSVIPFSIGIGGTGGNGGNGTAGTVTTFNTTSLVANGGGFGGWSNSTAGGSAGAGGTGGTGAAANFNGGAGGVGGAASGSNGGGGAGGGGAGGTTAVGGTAANVGTSTTGTNGGAGGATSGGSAGTQPGGTGGNGTVWTDTTTLATGGAGGGGGGGTGGISAAGTIGGTGGNYGAGGAGGGGGGKKGALGMGGNGINGVIVITYTSVANTTQYAYRFRSDDGNETTGTSLVAQNTAITGLALSTNIRLRFLVYNSGGSAASAQTFRLDYAPLSGSCSTSTFAPIPTSSGTDPFYMTTTSYYINGTASTNVSTGPAVIADPSGGTFIAGTLVSATSNTSASIILTSKGFTEVEYNFAANSNAVGGNTYCFRVSNSGTPINTYSQYAQATVAGGGPAVYQLLRHGEWFSNGIRQPFTF